MRQKGSGKARQGNIRSSSRKGGQKAHGPKGPRDYSFKLNRKVVRLGLRMALSVKAKHGQGVDDGSTYDDVMDPGDPCYDLQEQDDNYILVSGDADGWCKLWDVRMVCEYLQIDTSNILFICGGAFVDLDKVIQRRLGNHVLGFGAQE